MIELTINKDVINYAERKLAHVAEMDGRGLSKFGSERDRILIGYIGEKLVMDYLDIKDDSDDYNFDLVSQKGKRLEVKTVSCKFKPKSHYWCTVNSHDLDGVHKQKADYYIFLRILNDLSTGCLLGYMECSEFFSKAKFIEKGTDFGEFKFVKANATILEISKLHKFK